MWRRDWGKEKKAEAPELLWGRSNFVEGGRRMSAEGAKRIAETLLNMGGRAVVVRVRPTPPSPPTEVTLKPCLLKASGETAELLVAASAAIDVAVLPAQLFSVSSRVVADDMVWRVVSYVAVECGEAVICWCVQMAR
jgi:hypothetical protein